jgi:hypothetical protein
MIGRPPAATSIVWSIDGEANRDALARRVWLNEHDRGAPMSPDSGQDDPKNPVAPPEMFRT